MLCVEISPGNRSLANRNINKGSIKSVKISKTLIEKPSLVVDIPIIPCNFPIRSAAIMGNNVEKTRKTTVFFL
jgi:hypothetical protein